MLGIRNVASVGSPEGLNIQGSGALGMFSSRTPGSTCQLCGYCIIGKKSVHDALGFREMLLET